MFLFHASPHKTKTPLRFPKTVSGTLPVLALGGLLAMFFLAPARAQFTESESNNDKTTADVINLGTATSATISGTSATSAAADADYFRINTTYTTAGIYVNRLQLSNGTQNIGRIRGKTQNGGVINDTNPATGTPFQTSASSGTASPYGFNQYYSFGGAGKTQSVYYSVTGAGTTTGGAYTATFSSALIIPTDIGTINPGNITFDALANVGSSGNATNTSIIVLDSNYNVYNDNVTGIASNDNGSAGFTLKRRFTPGVYYFMVGISTLAINDAAAPDDASQNNQVLDFDNVAAANNTFYNGNAGNTRPADFKLTNAAGQVAYTSSGQVIPSLYALNFYKFTVAGAELPEPGSIALIAAGSPFIFLLANRSRRKRR